MKMMDVTYAGVPLSSASQLFPRRQIGQRVNYFEIPWCASIPGHGKVVVTSDQLLAIESAIEEGAGKGLLELSVLQDGTKVEEQSVAFEAYAVRSMPLKGETFSADVEVPIENESPASNRGLYVLELQDARCVHSMILMGTTGAPTLVNLRTASDKYDDTTINGANPWTYGEILNLLFGRLREVFDDASYTINVGALDSVVVNDLDFIGVPVTVCIDLLLGVFGPEQVVRFNPVTNNYYTSTLQTTGVFPLLQSLLSYRQYGGRHTLYPWSTRPDQYVRIDKNDLEADLKLQHRTSASTTTTPALVGTQVPLYRRGLLSSNTGVDYSRLNTFYYHAKYHGFHVQLLNEAYPITTVVLDWMGDMPQTEVVIDYSNPTKAVTSRLYAKDIPLKVRRDGSLFVERSSGAGSSSSLPLYKAIADPAGGRVLVQRVTALDGSTSGNTEYWNVI